jgi:DNA-binding beta-propeller fold protein YncE
MKRLLGALVIAGSALAMGGCTGDTDPASNVTNLSAKLNFHGKADNGPAYTYFEYWKTSTPNDKQTTPTVNWPAGASGSFGQTVTGLSPNTNYSFRVCGQDQGNSAACLSTKTFTTLKGTTYAFDRKWGSSGTGNGQFDSPVGVAVDSSATVYVADYNNNRVQKFTSAGGFLTTWGSSGSGDGQFNGPHGVSVDLSGNVYVTDFSNNRVQKFNSGGGFLTKWGSFGIGNGQFSRPADVAASREFTGTGFFSRVYVVDPDTGVQKFDSGGNFLAKWASFGSGDGQFQTPYGLGADPRGGYFYVADYGNDRIQFFTPAGTYSGKWGSSGTGNGQFQGPLGVAVDSSGDVYVADQINHRLQKFSATGAFIAKWGSNGSANGQFSYPARVAVDTYGYVYVADTLNNRIQKFKPTQ